MREREGRLGKILERRDALMRILAFSLSSFIKVYFRGSELPPRPRFGALSERELP